MLLIENDDTSGSEETAFSTHRTRCDLKVGSPRRRAIDEWQKRLAEFRHDNPHPIVLAWREESRRIYRSKQEAKGRTVRPYVHHNHATWLPGETHESRERRLHRDRAREKRGVNDATVRSWTDLSSMSPEEKLLHQRKLANERKARSREQRSTHATCDEMSAIEDALKDFDVEWGMF